jgi:hypothetical protein
MIVYDSGIADKIRVGLWAEFAFTASFYESRIVNKKTQQSLLQRMYNKQFKGSKNLKTFSEMCAVTTKKTIQGKMTEGLSVCMLDFLIIKQMMFTGYSTLRPNKSSNQEIQFGLI